MPRRFRRLQRIKLRKHVVVQQRNRFRIFQMATDFSNFQNELRGLIPSLDSRISCLVIPKSDIGCEEIVIANTTVCPKPLMHTRTSCAQDIHVYCSPPCNQPTWKIGAAIFDISLYVSVVIYWICIAIAFVTWAQGKKLYVIFP